MYAIFIFIIIGTMHFTIYFAILCWFLPCNDIKSPQCTCITTWTHHMSIYGIKCTVPTWSMLPASDIDWRCNSAWYYAYFQYLISSSPLLFHSGPKIQLHQCLLYLYAEYVIAIFIIPYICHYYLCDGHFLSGLR